jgi:gliding motility-associated-like protein
MTVCANIGTVNLAGSFTIATGATWSTTGTGTFAPNNTTMNVNYNPSGADTAAGFVKIYLTSTGIGNCLQVVDTVTIYFTKAPFVNAGTNQNLCPNMTFVQLNATTSALNYTWTTTGNGTFTPANNILNPAYAPGLGDYSAGSVTLILTSASVTCGQAADTVVVNFKPKPTSAFTYSNRCIGVPTSFTMAATTPTGTIVNWLWRFNNDTTTIKDPSYTFTSTGNQTVVLIVNNENCIDSIVKNVFINPGPTTAFDYTVLCHDSVQFVQSVTVSPGGISVWNWDFGDVTASLLQNPLHVYADTGLYIVTLQARSDSGCVGNRTDTVHVTRCANDFVTIIGEPAVPTGFTPNGDGSNDVLRVKGGPFNLLDFRIFNEWGQQIFRGEIQSDGWDGTFKNAPQPVGRFIWTVNGELIDGKKIKMAGETILSR